MTWQSIVKGKDGIEVLINPCRDISNIKNGLIKMSSSFVLKTKFLPIKRYNSRAVGNFCAVWCFCVYKQRQQGID